ncbi:MAG: hypothetical protein AAGL10_15170 [Pseudomonadota bacterium]
MNNQKRAMALIRPGHGILHTLQLGEVLKKFPFTPHIREGTALETAKFWAFYGNLK